MACFHVSISFVQIPKEMFKTILKKASMYVLIGLCLYLSVGYFLHLVIFPEQKPEISHYFKPGQEFYGKAEGFRQRVVKQENGFVYCSLQVDPFAEGPPVHIHMDFDETFEIDNGEISLWVDGEVKKLKPGEKLLIPRGTPHKPYNETADTIHITGPAVFPEKFAYHLVQVYGFMDNTPDFAKSPKTMMQMSLFTSAGFDSYVGDGPPVFMQRAVSFVLVPIARLAGFRSFYPEYDINPEGTL